jgi:cytochrome c-type biogenesis protein CcmH
VRFLLLALLVLLALAAAPARAATPQTTLPDVEDEVMCVQCGTALNVSTSPVADQERTFIRRRIAEGRTKAEIKRELVAEYGPEVLATPDQGGFDVAAWLVPALLVALALLGVGFAATRWRASAPRTPDPAVAGLTAAEARRLDDELRDFDR